MREELQAALAEFSGDPEMRVGIVTGSGRAFSAGADLKEMAEGLSDVRSRQTGEERIEGYRGNQPFSRASKPFIAAVNGLAVAAGMERAADCDIRIASTQAYFGLLEVKRGILPNYAINHLARVLPFGEAIYLMLTGDTLSVEEAHRLGFVHEVLEPEKLMPRAVEIADSGPVLAPVRLGRVLPTQRCGRPPGLHLRRRQGRPQSLLGKATPGLEGGLGASRLAVSKFFRKGPGNLFLQEKVPRQPPAKQSQRDSKLS